MMTGHRVMAGCVAFVAGVVVLGGWMIAASAVAQGQELGIEAGETSPRTGGAGVIPDAAEEAVIPRAYNFEDRYRAMGEESPFMLDATPDQVIVESPFRDLAVSSFYKKPEGTRVKVVNTKTRDFFYIADYELGPGDKNRADIKVVSLESNPNPRKVRILIEADGERGTISVDESLIGVAATGPAAPPPPQNRAIPNAQAVPPNRAASPSVTPRSDGTPSGRRRIVLPRPVPRPATGPGVTQPQVGAPGQAQPPQQQAAPPAPTANPPGR
ncbi:MAG: hypothetical protein AAGD22_17000 [Verrucomicrobiota bacterium]